MISIDTIRCPDCDEIVMVLLPSNTLELEEYRTKMHKHYRDSHPDLIDDTGWL